MLSRIVNTALLVLMGAVLGGVGTVAHQITATWGLTIPIGVIGSLLAFAALLSGLRLLGSSRLPALLAAFGAIATVVVFTQQSPGGSVLIPDNFAGQLWLLGSILIAAVAVAWPDLRRRPVAAPPALPGNL